MSPGFTYGQWPLYRQHSSMELGFNWDLSSLFSVSFLTWTVSFWNSVLRTNSHRIFTNNLSKQQVRKTPSTKMVVPHGSVENGLEIWGFCIYNPSSVFLVGCSLKESWSRWVKSYFPVTKTLEVDFNQIRALPTNFDVTSQKLSQPLHHSPWNCFELCSWEPVTRQPCCACPAIAPPSAPSALT